MPIYVCVKCQARFQPKKLGVTVIETTGKPPQPARIWSADLLGCPVCQTELIARFSHEPMMDSYESGFDKVLAEIPQDRRYILHNPEYLAQSIQHETTYVRSHDKHKKRLRTTDR